MEKAEKYINIRNISLVFFAICGLLHFGSGIFIANNLYLKEATILGKIMDIPFVLTGLLYAFSSIRINLTNPHQENKTLDIILISVILIILIALIVVNFVFPDIK